MGGCGSSYRVPKEKQFRRAIKLYEVTEVRTLTNILNRNKCFENGENPLTLAAKEGHEAVVQALVKAGADPNKVDANGQAPLHIAVYLNDEETVDILLSYKANPTKYDGNNMTPLHIACERGHKGMVKKLLAAGATPDEAKRGVPPLIHAVINGHTKCLEMLLKNGADPEVCDARGHYALPIAVANSSVPCVETLLRFDANIHRPSKDDEMLLCVASLNGCAGAVQALINAGCDPNSYNEDDVPPLIAATARGCPDCVDTLVDGGAEVDILDKKNHSALYTAVMSAVDMDREVYYCKYFSNVYRNFSKYDPLEVFPENSTKCAMGLVQGGADVSKVWDRFVQVFPSPQGVTFEQMVLCEVMIQAYGFRSIAKNRIRAFVVNLLNLGEYGLIKLLYSAGVDPVTDDLYILGLRNKEDNNRQMFSWVKKLKYSPRQLKDLCRKEVRYMISWNVLHLVDYLDVPAPLKEYISIVDTEHYSYPESSATSPT